MNLELYPYELDDWMFICDGSNCKNCEYDCDDWEEDECH